MSTASPPQNPNAEGKGWGWLCLDPSSEPVLGLPWCAGRPASAIGFLIFRARYLQAKHQTAILAQRSPSKMFLLFHFAGSRASLFDRENHICNLQARVFLCPCPVDPSYRSGNPPFSIWTLINGWFPPGLSCLRCPAFGFGPGALNAGASFVNEYVWGLRGFGVLRLCLSV